MAVRTTKGMTCKTRRSLIPVVEEFKKDMDFSVLAETIPMTPEQRLQRLVYITKFLRRSRPELLKTTKYFSYYKCGKYTYWESRFCKD